MNIKWSIHKKRGNFRPKLVWSIGLEAFEKGLALATVEVQTSIPRPPADWESFCYPGAHERQSGWQPSEFYALSTPAHKTGELSGSCRLPWRESNCYPEVEQGFILLRSAFEQALQAAYDSLPLIQSNSLQASPEAKKHLAPGFAAQRLLQAVGAAG